MNASLLVPSRYCGPPRSGNGGYVAGSLAGRLQPVPGQAVTVSLRRPPPLDTAMEVLGTPESGLRLTDQGRLVAEASLADADSLEVVEAVSYGLAATASEQYPGHDFHPFPTCFSCGTARADGLRIHPGEVPSSDGRRVAAPWVPDASLAPDAPPAPGADHEDGVARASLAATWAALDCVGGWAGDVGRRLMVLGRMTAVVDDLPAIGEPHVVMGHHRGTEGRKTHTASTLHDSDGRVVGLAEHLWIAVDPEVFNADAN